MKSVVKQAMRGRNLDIIKVSETKEKKHLAIVFQKKRPGARSYQSEGQLTLKAIEGGKTAIKIENPDYHYSVPSHQREDFEEVVFN